MLSRSVVENVELAAKLPMNAAGSDRRLSHWRKARRTTSRSGWWCPRSPEGQTADFWTGVLMLAVVVLALTLGWMVGHAGWKRATVSAQGNGQGRQVQGLQNQVPEQAVKQPAPELASPVVNWWSIRTVSWCFRNRRSPRAEVVASQTSVQPAVDRGQIPVARPVRISPDVASELVTQRVEPEYPPSARERRVQGAVDLDALISKHGVVEKFTAIRGDPDLAAAASAAVRQWRFKPYELNGQPEPFQTHITVVFRLP